MSDEQQQQQQQQQVDLSGVGKPIAAPSEQMASKADLLAAFREATDDGGTENGAAPAETQAAATQTAATETNAPKEAPAKELVEAAKAELAKVSGAPAVEAAPAEPKIMAQIRAREEAQRKRQEANDDAARIRADADAYRLKVEQEARAKAQAEVDAERQRFRELFGRNPLEAIESSGIPKEQLVAEVARSDTPEMTLLRQERAARAKLEAELAEMREWRKEQTNWREEQKQERERAARANVERTFLDMHATSDKTPGLRKLPERVVLMMAHTQADEWRAQGIPFALSDIAEYLEHQLRTAGAGAQQVAASGKGQASQAKANGTRTLTAASGSERRASPKPIDELTDPAERRQALIEAYRDAATGTSED